MTAIDKYPIILGKDYIHTNGTIARLVSADIKKDEIVLKCSDNIWQCNINYSTFRFYFTLKPY
jgi:hypothetical protein